jgi:hypothetical protein
MKPHDKETQKRIEDEANFLVECKGYDYSDALKTATRRVTGK